MTLLYAAFAVVALWLLGELLLQRRAPLHWRALALVGFLVLVAGVAQGSLPLIGVGVVAFGAGQALATRAVKHAGDATHWSLVAPESVPVVGRLFGGEPSAPAPKGRSRRARPEPAATPERGPVPEPVPVSAAEPQAADTEAAAVEATAVFQAEEYAVEGDSVYYPSTDPQQQEPAYYAYGYTAEQQASSYADPYQESYADPYAQQYQEYPQYQPYAEPQQSYASYEQQPDYAQQYPAEYAPQYGGYEGYDQGQQPYYTQDPQYHAPQG
ncbi:hypothetical protein [Streptacidiphilus anmyonensis]|uniref:hypothetical protein n=1 Tax=Streptacidiphilus anmyonensis TaxID=405782 RepID=UPI000A51ED2F|nr:hypothetical protein [Streptacidiphilus anmyonensis]